MMEQTVELMKKSKLPVKSIMGGAPETLKFSKKIGAEGYSEDATSAVARGRNLTANPSEIS